MDLTQVLIHAGSSEITVRGPAENQLKAFEAQNLPAYLHGLCMELGNESKPEPARQLAGLLLKNSIVAKDEQQRLNLAQRWLRVADDARREIRRMILLILGSPHKNIRSTASLVVSKVAAIEIPNKSWPDLIQNLVNNIMTGTSSDALKQASFEALGYVCEECSEQLQAQSVLILSAIAQGMRKEVTNNEIKLAATLALVNSLDFVRDNFNNQNDRNLIMQMIFSVSQCEEAKVRVAAYQCLVEIVASYYSVIGPYMPDVFRLTATAIQREQEEVAQQAIEFWSSVCDEEIEVLEEHEAYQQALRQAGPASGPLQALQALQAGAAQDQDAPKKPDRVCQNFAAQALPSLLPLILAGLTKQSEEVDDDTWNVAMASGTCLGLLAQTVRDQIIKLVVPFIQQHITNSNWRFREAATLAFGCILEGPSPEQLGPMVSQAFPLILQHMRDQSAHVKDTASWTVGRICNLLPETVNDKVLPRLMEAFLQGLQDVPKVASNICWALHNLAGAVKVGPEERTSVLSRYFEQLMRALLFATERPDAGEANLLGSGYEAINVMIQTAAPDTYALIGQLVPGLMQRLAATFRMQGLSAEEREKQNEVQALLASALTVVIQKLESKVIVPHADNLMGLFIQVLQSKNATIHEEALMAIGALSSRVNEGFLKYMGAFRPFLVLGLKNAAEQHVCTVAVGVVGDLSRALGDRLAPFCDEIMQALLENLANPALERSVKPHIIGCLGDIALGIGGHFTRYLVYVVGMLQQAGLTRFDKPDADALDYLNALREAILEAYTGILQGLSSHKKDADFLPYADTVLNLLDLIARSQPRDDAVVRAAVGVIGDLASRLGTQLAPVLKRPSVNTLIMTALASETASTAEAGDWARSSIQKLL